MYRLSASSQYFDYNSHTIQNKILPILQNSLAVVIVIQRKFQESLMYDFQNTLKSISNTTNFLEFQCYRHIS